MAGAFSGDVQEVRYAAMAGAFSGDVQEVRYAAMAGALSGDVQILLPLAGKFQHRRFGTELSNPGFTIDQILHRNFFQCRALAKQGKVDFTEL